MKKLILILCVVPFFSSCNQTKAIVSETTAFTQNYWQQQVDYTMDIDVDAKNFQYKGKQTLVYTNNSPDELRHVYYHLYFNAFQPNSQMDIRSRNIKDPDRRVTDRISKLTPEEIIPLLNKHCNIPVISAGGIGTKDGIDTIMNLGAAGLSIGSPFIACEEAHISKEYKQACVDYGKEDIVFTTKISGTPCTVINTPYVQKTGTTQNWLEKLMSKNKKIKKWVKMITYFKGMKSVENAAFSSTYKTVWCAGPSIEHTTEILPIKEIIKRLTT